MKVIRQKRALLSASFAILACLSAALGVEGVKTNDGTSNLFWPYLQPIFSIFSSDSAEVAVKPSPAFPLTDNNLILLFFVGSIILAIASIGFGMAARKRGEHSIVYAGAVVFSVLIVISIIPYIKWVPVK